jgi:predicted negative regulator of RcsB-dependent stress response
MSEQKVSNERKKELVQMDPFQENLIKALAYAKEYRKRLLLICCALVSVILIFSGIMYSFKIAELKSSAIIAQALNEYGKLREDPVKGYLEVKDDFNLVSNKYSNTVTGKMAKVRFAKICYDASEYDKAFDLYKKSFDEFKNDESMKNFLLASLGHVSQARNKLDDAKTYFLEIENGQSILLKDEAKFALAMLYETDGDIKTSHEFYRKVVADHDNSIYKSMVESKIASWK